MRRGYVTIIVLVLSSLACVFINLINPSPTLIPTSPPASTPIPVITRTPGPTSEEPTKTPYPTSALDAQLSARDRPDPNPGGRRTWPATQATRASGTAFPRSAADQCSQ